MTRFDLQRIVDFLADAPRRSTDLLFQCGSCRNEVSAGNGVRYCDDCPHRPHGYDPFDNLQGGAKLPEDALCLSWTPDRAWYFSRNTDQRIRDMGPNHLKP